MGLARDGEDNTNALGYGPPMAIQICTVALRTPHGYLVYDVPAESLYEAVILGWDAARKTPPRVDFPPTMKIQVTIKGPAPRELVTTLGQAQAWLRAPGKTPEEHERKRRLREIAASGSRRR